MKFEDDCSETFSWVSLPLPIWEGSVEVSTGTCLKAIYYGPLSGRMFIKVYSCFAKRTGEHEGELYKEVSPCEFFQACYYAGINPPDSIEAETIS